MNADKNNSISNLAEFIVNDFMMPIARILGVYESSTYYNYLPGETEDPEDLAPFFYYREIYKIRDSIKSCDHLPGKLRKRMLKIWEDLRFFISSCEGPDSLRLKWIKANPSLIMYKANTQLIYGISKAFDSDRYIVADLIIAFVKLTLSMIKTDDLRNLVNKYACEAIDRAAFTRLSDREMNSLRKYASEKRNDVDLFKKEAEKRNRIIHEIYGNKEKTRLSDRAKSIRKRIQNEDGYRVYRAIEDDEKIIMLCITPEILYWDNQRPFKGPIGTYAFGYIEHDQPCENDGYGQINLDFLEKPE